MGNRVDKETKSAVVYDIQRFFFDCSFAQALTFGRESITLKRGPNPVRRKEIIIHGDFG